MLGAGCGYPVVPSFSSFFTATVQWVLAEELTQMEIISDVTCLYLEVSLQNTSMILGMPQRASRRLQNVL